MFVTHSISGESSEQDSIVCLHLFSHTQRSVCSGWCYGEDELCVSYSWCCPLFLHLSPWIKTHRHLSHASPDKIRCWNLLLFLSVIIMHHQEKYVGALPHILRKYQVCLSPLVCINKDLCVITLCDWENIRGHSSSLLQKGLCLLRPLVCVSSDLFMCCVCIA